MKKNKSKDMPLPENNSEDNIDIPESKETPTDDTEYMVDKPTFHVGIGASAGGLEALEQFFSNMPADSGMAFIVIQHLSPDYKSMMVELLSRHTKMQVIRSEDGMQVKANRVYLIPPKQNMTIFHGKLYLTPQDHHRGLNLPIDIFLRSLAIDQEKHAIGVILSGTGSDGTLGIRAIKEVGGMVMVQDNVSAKFDGMPKSAVATALVDYILPPDKMPEELLKYVQHPYINKRESTDDFSMLGTDVLSKILEIIRTRVGVDFTYYKPNTLIRRLERRVSINQINEIENYIVLLSESPQEVKILYKELLIGVTQFFRDSEAYDVIEKKVIPSLLEDRDKKTQIRVWDVGCSTGEEAYSLAIMFREYMDTHNADYDVKIFATDLDKDAIEHAGVGIYPESIASDVNQDRLQQYFTKTENGYQVNESIRRMVIFAPQNITKDPPFSKIDFISCRNVLIYLKSEMQKKILSMFHFAMRDDGYLFLGSSESIGDLSDVFITIDSKWKIYKYNQNAKMPVLNDFFMPQTAKAKRKTIPEPVYTKRNESNGLENIYEYLLNEFIPPSILVDEQFDVVQVFGDVNKYIHIPTGKISWNLLKLVRTELSVLLGSVLHKVKKEKKDIRYKDVNVKDKEEVYSITLSAKILEDKKEKQTYLLVTFEKSERVEVKDHSIEDFDVNTKYKERIQELERELMVREESLQTTLEEMETSNEELQATNEELIASNEELQSTNEELQSVNEELYTVNSEYHNKIEELTALNNDINNLLKNTNIGTLFLDGKLRIRKFTKGITKIINILDIDIGRPISHISFNSLYPNFYDDIEDVMNTLVPKSIELKDNNADWHMMRILPYRTMENAVNGIIITLVEITDLKKKEEEVKRERDLLKRILDDSPLGKIMVNKNGKVTYLNKPGYKILELPTDFNFKDYSLEDFDFIIKDAKGQQISKQKTPFQMIAQSKTPLRDYHLVFEWPEKQSKNIRMNGSPIFNEKHEIIGAVYSIED